MLTVTAEITPVRCWIQQMFFYDLQPDKIEFERCEIFAISSYRNEPLSLNVKILSNGGLFHDLPVWAAQTTQELRGAIPFDRLVYHNCPDNNITLNEFRALRGQCWVWFDKWILGQYHATIDWFEDNYNIHFVSLDTGQFCFMPSHKVVFKSPKGSPPPDYKKKRYNNQTIEGNLRIG